MSKRRVQFRDEVVDSCGNDVVTVAIPVPVHHLWYSPADYVKFRSEDAGTQQQQHNSHFRSREFVLSLLSQQDEHRLLGITDPKGLQVHSRACSKVAKERARQAAIVLAKEMGHGDNEKPAVKSRRCRTSRPRFMRYSAPTSRPAVAA